MKMLKRPLKVMIEGYASPTDVSNGNSWLKDEGFVRTYEEVDMALMNFLALYKGNCQMTLNFSSAIPTTVMVRCLDWNGSEFTFNDEQMGNAVTTLEIMDKLNEAIELSIKPYSTTVDAIIERGKMLLGNEENVSGMTVEVAHDLVTTLDDFMEISMLVRERPEVQKCKVRNYLGDMLYSVTFA